MPAGKCVCPTGAVADQLNNFLLRSTEDPIHIQREARKARRS